MAKEEDGSLNRSSSPPKESAANESFVRMVSSRVSGFIPSFSKWFNREEGKSTVRYRDEEGEDDDDQSVSIQPPAKKLKLPTEPSFKYNNFTLNSLSTPIAESSRHDHFTEPIAGPSGVKSRKLVLSSSREQSVRKEIANGDSNSDSGDSTSGYSSMARIGSKEQIPQNVEKSNANQDETAASVLFNNTSSPQNEETTRSLFHERSFTPRSNSSLSSRRPSFSASPTFVDRTISTQRVLNSPFYNGRTIYGGASAYGRRLGRSSSELRSNLNSSVQVKLKNEGSNDSMVLSKTARRILDTLEQYTTPVNDAKKIPVGRRNAKQEGLFAKYTGANPYRRDSKVASNTELHVPTVPELLKMKQQLQESTEAVRQIATTSKSNLNKEEYKLPMVEEDSTKHTSKIKTKVCAVRKKAGAETGTIEQVKLPAVSLPISTLPKFDFSVPPLPSYSKSPVVTQPKEPIKNKTETKLVPKEKTNPTTEYKFSDPLVITENIESIIGSNNFKFSEPILKKQLANNFKVSDATEFKPKRVQKNNGELQPAPQLVTGSVMDVLGKKSSNLMDKFKPPEGTWECPVCMVRNKSDTSKCVACESPKNQDTFAKQSLMDKFKPQEGTWECSVCMVRNKPDVTKCVACESSKTPPPPKNQSADIFGKQSPNLMDKFKPPEGTWECSMCMIRNKPGVSICVACESPKVAPPPKNQNADLFTKQSSNLWDKFKPPDSMWECPVCMIRNQPETTKCAACGESRNTAKPPEPQQKSLLPSHNSTLVNKPQDNVPSSFGEQFKPPTDTWECSSCLVRNKALAEKCVACESLKPELKKKLSYGFGEQFKKKDCEWVCDSCMVKNASDKMKCVCCEAAKPGSNLDDKKSGFTKFSFGVDKQATSKFTFGFKAGNNVPLQQQNSNSLLSENAPKLTAPPVAVPFAFGITTPSNKTTTESENKKTTPQTQPVFGIVAAQPTVEEKETPPATTNSSLSASSPAPKTATITSLPIQTNIFDSAKSENTTKPLFQFRASTVNKTTDETKPSFVSSTAMPKTFALAPDKSDSEPPAKMPNFSYDQKTDAPKLDSSASQSNSAPFSFGSENKTPTFQFNAPTNTPAVAVSQLTQNGFNFGNNGTSNSGGFSFGKTSATATGVFNFGNGSQPAAPAGASGGFNFTATPPAFNPNVQPTFNFTAGTGAPVSFSAQPSTNGTALPQRKYKRALRRANR